ncbi:MAG: sensor histidine kinase [Cyclobacteriaceae bacterium]|jgi:two-component system LytT family sensor kinase
MLRNRKKLYWFFTLSGWLAMMAIEVLNYTFFIVGTFSWNFVWIFGYYATIGAGMTHLFRHFIKRSTVFDWRPREIWLLALASTFVISVIVNLLTTIPFVIREPENTTNLFSFIAIFGGTLNSMRYIGVWIIIYFLYQILERSSHLKEAKLESEGIARTMELELLKAQLNPHFLFNALNSIKALVSIDQEKCKDAIVKLSELLRFTLQSGNQTLIPLADEMEEVKKYLSLEQIRFGERFQFDIQMDESAGSQMVPPAMVLTLAENAIKHGITKTPGHSKLGLTATDQSDLLTIKMTNPGILEKNDTAGFGLLNIRKRLMHIYNSRASFHIQPINEGVEAIITILK